jgi:hypothetical protein
MVRVAATLAAPASSVTEKLMVRSWPPGLSPVANRTPCSIALYCAIDPGPEIERVCVAASRSTEKPVRRRPGVSVSPAT